MSYFIDKIQLIIYITGYKYTRCNKKNIYKNRTYTVKLGFLNINGLVVITQKINQIFYIQNNQQFINLNICLEIKRNKKLDSYQFKFKIYMSI